MQTTEAFLQRLQCSSIYIVQCHSATVPGLGTEEMASLTKLTKLNKLKVVNRGTPSSACTSLSALVLLIPNIFSCEKPKSVSYLSRPMNEC